MHAPFHEIAAAIIVGVIVRIIVIVIDVWPEADRESREESAMVVAEAKVAEAMAYESTTDKGPAPADHPSARGNCYRADAKAAPANRGTVECTATDSATAHCSAAETTGADAATTSVEASAAASAATAAEAASATRSSRHVRR